MSGADAAALFESRGVLDYLYKNYEVLHTQEANFLMDDIDNYMNATNDSI